MRSEPQRKSLTGSRRSRHDRAARLGRLRSWGGPAALAAGAALALYFGLREMPWTSSATRYYVGYQCWRNAYDCRDFRTHAEAQAVYQACGGPRNDVHHLDTDGDGLACEYLP